MRLELSGFCGDLREKLSGYLRLRHFDEKRENFDRKIFSPRRELSPRKPFHMTWELDAKLPWPFYDFAFQWETSPENSGDIFIDAVRVEGEPHFDWPEKPQRLAGGALCGFLQDFDRIHHGPWQDGGESYWKFIRNRGRGLIVTGNRDWKNYCFSAKVFEKFVEAFGLIVRYQGLERYYALVKKKNSLLLIKRYDGEDEVLAETRGDWPAEQPRHLSLLCEGEGLRAFLDEEELFSVDDRSFSCGGGGFFGQKGSFGAREISLSPLSRLQA
jgi:hypothetical protein